MLDEISADTGKPYLNKVGFQIPYFTLKEEANDTSEGTEIDQKDEKDRVRFFIEDVPEAPKQQIIYMEKPSPSLGKLDRKNWLGLWRSLEYNISGLVCIERIVSSG